MDCRDDIDALEALRQHIDQELLDLSFLSDGGSLERRELKKSTSAPDLRDFHITVTDMESSSVCIVDDLSQESSGAVRSSTHQPYGDVKQSKGWLDTFL